MKKSSIAAVLTSISIFSAVLLAGQNAIALMPKVPLTELKQASHSIIRGKVVGMKSEWNEDGSFIWTFVDIEVSQRIKGNGKQGDVIVVKTQDGTVGDMTQISSNTATFKRGEDVIVLLGKETYSGKEYFNVIGMELGKFTIKGGKIVEKGVSVNKFLDFLKQ